MTRLSRHQGVSQLQRKPKEWRAWLFCQSHDDVAHSRCFCIHCIAPAFALSFHSQGSIQAHSFTCNDQPLQIPTSNRWMGCLECLLAWIPPQRQLETILDLVCAHSWEHHGSWLARTSFESFSEANISFPEGHRDGRLIRQVQGHTND